ncbi:MULTISPECIES: DUF4305 domain-containing protein [Paraliobacillus]|uniref:DUF4305 domain-containing protein n=1 Tax=Paraliobacillus TaxID=200903 RepID=UPI000DD49DDE|nr:MULTISPECIES: DUF4305 domain-containing protein [Paraliobacillus]
MRTSPLVAATFYIGIGIAFTYIGITSIQETGWSLLILLFAIFATLDFAVAIRLIRIHIHIKKAKNSK